MSGRKVFFVLLILSCLPGFCPNVGFLSGSSQPDKRELAIQWFNEGRYKDALPLFSKLCYDLPYDFIVKYFYGACLVETGNFGLDAEKNLVLASSGEVTGKVYFYLGRLYHGRGDWNNALRFYNRFRNNADNQVIAEMKVDDLIQLCYKQINPFLPQKVDSLVIQRPKEVALKKDTVKTIVIQNADSAKITTEKVRTGESELVKTAVEDSVLRDSSQLLKTIQPVPVIPEEETHNPDAKVADVPDVKKKPDPVKFIDFQINDKVTYLVEDMFHEAEAKNEFRIALNKENQLDSLLKVVQTLRKNYHLSVDPLIRDSLAIKIQNFEYQNLVLNTEVDQHYFKSRKLEQQWWSKAANSTFEEYSGWRDSLLQIRNAQYLPEIVKIEEQIPDSVIVPASPDSSMVAPEKNEDSDLVYKIQIGAFNKGIPTQRKLQFERLQKIRTIEKLTLEDGITVYTTGNLKNYDDALKLQTQIRLEGIKDAFVIAIRNGKKVTLPKEIIKSTNIGKFSPSENTINE